MMDWQVRPSARESQVSGQAFAPGSRVRSILWRDEAGLLQRLDVLDAESGAAPVSGPVLGWWVRVVRDPAEDPEGARRRAWQATAEELFLNQPEDGEAGDEEALALRLLVALQLERKRRLRPVGSPVDGVQEYRHPASGRHFRVKLVPLPASEIARLGEALERLLG